MWLTIELHLGPLWFTSRFFFGKSDHETWDPQKTYFHAYIIHCYGPTRFAVREAKEVLSLQITRDHDKEMLF